MKIAATIKEVKDFLSQARGPVGFVPTMGALHAGHISLIETSLAENSCMVVSIFVNPTQFNDKNDLDNYPRSLEEDLEKLRKAGVSLAFIPHEREIYPEPDQRIFDLGELDKTMEGATRPGHFNGVAQVVSKLFDIVSPDKAYFGEKDFQQVAVIKRLIRITGSDTRIVVCPTVREEDGLAMSSRNELLEPAYRAAAPSIFRIMSDWRKFAGELAPRQLEQKIVEEIEKTTPLKVIYFQLVDADTLRAVDDWNGKCNVQGCIAVQAGKVRLIDNIRFV